MRAQATALRAVRRPARTTPPSTTPASAALALACAIAACAACAVARADAPGRFGERLGVPIDASALPALGAALPSGASRAGAPGPAAPLTLALPRDRDRDGVLDDEDACPRSGRGVRVGPDGCLSLEPEAATVSFAPGSAWLSPAAARRLETARAVLARFPRKRLEVVASARVVGDDDGALSLALRRAETVTDWFAERGVPSGRIDLVAVARRGAGTGADRDVTLRLLH